MRYMRCPGAPNGHATKRDAVSAPRRTYPAASHEPATYSSPTTPTGTGRNHSSRTKDAAPVTGMPIGTAGEPAVSGALTAA